MMSHVVENLINILWKYIYLQHANRTVLMVQYLNVVVKQKKAAA